MKEYWKNINGFEGLYQISCLGRVRSLDREKWNGKTYVKIKGIIIKKLNESHGYVSFSLSKDGIRRNYKAHKLVAEHFISNPEGLEMINHIDGNKKNNCVNNLEWCISAENNKHAWSTGLKYSTSKQRETARRLVLEGKNARKAVICIENSTTYKSVRECGRVLGISHSRISEVLNNKQESVRGLHFKYLEVGHDNN